VSHVSRYLALPRRRCSRELLAGTVGDASTSYIDITMDTLEDTSPSTSFGKALAFATALPGVRINRSAYLRRSLARHCGEAQIARAILETPAAAGIPADIIKKIAEASIRHEAAKVTALSAAAGLPGGLAMFGTIPADAAQYLAHMLRIAQKLAYLYSWPELFSDDADEPDDATQNVLTLFVGVMFGVQAANKGIGLVSLKIAEQAAKQLPRKALTKGVIYPIVKSVASRLGVQMSKTVFANAVAKIIPLAGSILSGGLTLATFMPMCSRLRNHLANLPPAVAKDFEESVIASENADVVGPRE